MIDWAGGAKFFGKLPFAFEAFENFDLAVKNCACAWVAMVGTYVLAIGIMYFIVRAPGKVPPPSRPPSSPRVTGVVKLRV